MQANEKNNDFRIGDEVVMPNLFSRYKFRVPDDESYTIDKIGQNGLIYVSNNKREFSGHFSHFAKKT